MMPLPPALAARLAKRGILRDASVAGFDPQAGKVIDQPTTGNQRSGSGGGSSYGYEGRSITAEEEVFAESYDDNAVTTPSYDNNNPSQGVVFKTPDAVDPNKYLGHSGCPNKYNPHHTCVQYCRQYWGSGAREPFNQEYIAAHSKLVELFYPLPDGWREMYDCGVGRHYYWNTKTDKVSWLPPGHPKSQPGDPASKVRENLALAPPRQEDNTDNMDLDSDNDSDEEEDRRIEEQRRREKEKRREEERRIVSGDKKKGRSRGRDEDALDPMDPAAYSDVPRGNWSTGLPDQGSAKTGVDSTASGPLFQQRPYPSPGAILRANAGIKD